MPEGTAGFKNTAQRNLCNASSRSIPRLLRLGTFVVAVAALPSLSRRHARVFHIIVRVISYIS